MGCAKKPNQNKTQKQNCSDFTKRLRWFIYNCSLVHKQNTQKCFFSSDPALLPPSSVSPVGLRETLLVFFFFFFFHPSQQHNCLLLQTSFSLQVWGHHSNRRPPPYGTGPTDRIHYWPQGMKRVRKGRYKHHIYSIFRGQRATFIVCVTERNLYTHPIRGLQFWVKPWSRGHAGLSILKSVQTKLNREPAMQPCGWQGKVTDTVDLRD